MRTMVAAILAILASPASAASPDCSTAGPTPSSECKAKLDYCCYTSIALVLAYRARFDGKTEDATLLTLANATKEIWYERNRDVVKDIVHQLYTNDSFYQKLKARITPNVGGMAMAISAITDGCNADTKVTIESR